METLIKSQSLQKVHASKSRTRITSLLETAEAMRFGISPAILTIVVCLSGITAATAIENDIFQLMLVGFPTAIFISSIIAVAPMRIIFSLAIATTLIDVFVLIFG